MVHTLRMQPCTQSQTKQVPESPVPLCHCCSAAGSFELLQDLAGRSAVTAAAAAGAAAASVPYRPHAWRLPDINLPVSSRG